MKILFILIDILSAIMMALGTVLIVSLIVGKGWNMFAAMMIGMALGMTVLFLVALIMSGITTLFELMPGGMLIAMPTGMAAGMANCNGAFNLAVFMIGAAIFSVAIQSVMEIYNLTLKGEVPLEQR